MKGVVMEVRQDACVILRSDGSFVETKNRQYQPGQQVSLRSGAAGAWALLAACLMLLCTAAFGWRLPTGYIYMDINPSIRLEVNCFGRVVSAVGLNEDARDLLEKSGSLTGAVDTCMEQVIEQCRLQGYIPDTGADLEIHLCTNREKLEKQVQQTARELDGEQVTVSVYRVSREHNQESLRSGISPKRLDAVRQYTAHFGGTLEKNAEELKGVPTNEIFQRLRQAGAQVEPGAEADYISARRKKAVRVYTDKFGGTVEENMEKLRGLTIEEIHTLIREGTTP